MDRKLVVLFALLAFGLAAQTPTQPKLSILADFGQGLTIVPLEIDPSITVSVAGVKLVLKAAATSHTKVKLDAMSGLVLREVAADNTVFLSIDTSRVCTLDRPLGISQK